MINTNGVHETVVPCSHGKQCYHITLAGKVQQQKHKALSHFETPINSAGMEEDQRFEHISL